MASKYSFGWRLLLSGGVPDIGMAFYLPPTYYIRYDTENACPYPDILRGS